MNINRIFSQYKKLPGLVLVLGACLTGVIFVSSLNSFLENRQKYKAYTNIIAVHKIINSKKVTSPKRWGQWHITPTSLIVIPVATDYFIQIESWHIAG